MSIDIQTEKLISLGEACREVPPNGVSTATMARWIQRGVRGVQLETVFIGGRRLTSREAIQRFIDAQNTPVSTTAAITAKQRRKQSEAARAELEKIGV